MMTITKSFWRWQWKKMQEDTNDLEIIKH